MPKNKVSPHKHVPDTQRFDQDLANKVFAAQKGEFPIELQNQHVVHTQRTNALNFLLGIKNEFWSFSRMEHFQGMRRKRHQRRTGARGVGHRRHFLKNSAVTQMEPVEVPNGYRASRRRREFAVVVENLHRSANARQTLPPWAIRT